MNARLIACGWIAAVLVGASACGNDDNHGKKDASLNTGAADNVPPIAHNMPDTFPNIVEKCIGNGWRAFVTSDRKVIIMADPHCPGYDPKQQGSVTVPVG